MSTITKDGQVYQCHKIYLDDTGKIGFIRALYDDGRFEMSMNEEIWTAKSICLNTYESGTVTPAPIVPENGNWYRVKLTPGAIQTLYFIKNHWYWTEEGRPFISYLNSVTPLSKITVEAK